MRNILKFFNAPSLVVFEDMMYDIFQNARKEASKRALENRQYDWGIPEIAVEVQNLLRLKFTKPLSLPQYKTLVHEINHWQIAGPSELRMKNIQAELAENEEQMIKHSVADESGDEYIPQRQSSFSNIAKARFEQIMGVIQGEILQSFLPHSQPLLKDITQKIVSLADEISALKKQKKGLTGLFSFFRHSAIDSKLKILNAKHQYLDQQLLPYLTENQNAKQFPEPTNLVTWGINSKTALLIHNARKELNLITECQDSRYSRFDHTNR